MKTNAQIVIKMPLRGEITVAALGKGKSKVKTVEMLEELRPRLLRTFQCWYQMQFGTDELKSKLRLSKEKMMNLNCNTEGNV